MICNLQHFYVPSSADMFVAADDCEFQTKCKVVTKFLTLLETFLFGHEELASTKYNSKLQISSRSRKTI